MTATLWKWTGVAVVVLVAFLFVTGLWKNVWFTIAIAYAVWSGKGV